MKQHINRSAFHDAFSAMNRSEQFSYKGLNALFDYLENLEEDTGEEIELDVIALCCDYTELSIENLEAETGCASLEQLMRETMVIELDDETIIYQCF